MRAMVKAKQQNNTEMKLSMLLNCVFMYILDFIKIYVKNIHIFLISNYSWQLFSWNQNVVWFVVTKGELKEVGCPISLNNVINMTNQFIFNKLLAISLQKWSAHNTKGKVYDIGYSLSNSM